MNEEQNLSIVRRAYDAFGRADIPGLLALMDDHISWVTPGPADLPTAGTRTGHSGAVDFFQALAAVVDITRFEPREFIAQGDRVIVIGDETAHVRATGRAVEFRWVHAFTLRDGKVTAFEEFGDVSPIVTEARSARASA